MANNSQLTLFGASVSIIAIVAMFLVNKFFNKKDKLENVFLKNPDEKYEVKLIDKKILNKDTRIFRFGLDSPDQQLGLPIGQHICLVEKINDELAIRKYTPITSDDTKGYFELIIKVYFRDVHPKFPDGGKMTQYLESLKIGDKIKIKGPNGKIFYKKNGHFEIRHKKTEVKTYHFDKLGLIAGGSGIAPMYQLMQAILSDPNDKTKIELLFANQSEEDILLREEIEEMAKKHPDQFKFWYTVDRSTPDWKYSTGFIDENMIKEHLPASEPKTAIFMCGPPPMIKFACVPNLEKLNFTEDNYFKY